MRFRLEKAVFENIRKLAEDRPTKVLWLIFLSLVLLKVSLLILFPSPWIFSDEQSYFGMAAKILQGNFSEITNSHKPGYSALIAPALLAGSAATSYKIALVINSLISSSVVFVSYWLYSRVFAQDHIRSIALSLITAILPQFLLYNYVLLSENLNILLVYCVFTTFCYLLIAPGEKKPVSAWVALGLMLGSAMTIKSQNVMLLFASMGLIFYCAVSNLARITGPILAAIVTIGTHFLLNRLVFSETGSYPELRNGYILALTNALTDPTAFIGSVRIFLGEISALFMGLLITPTFLAVRYLLSDSENNRVRALKVYALAFSTLSILLTTAHANYVYFDSGRLTTYTRYIDILFPVLFSLGIAAPRQPRCTTRTTLCFVATIVASVGLLNFSGNIFANSFSIYAFEAYGTIASAAYVTIVAVILYFASIKGKTGVIVSLLILSTSLLSAPSLFKQIRFSQDTYALYGAIGRWFDENNVRGKSIIIDSALLAPAGGSELEYQHDSGMDYINLYSLSFWAGNHNTIDFGDASGRARSYVISNRLLPRRILAANGKLVLYDESVVNTVLLDPVTIHRIGTGVRPPENGWIWMNSDGRLKLNVEGLGSTKTITVALKLRGLIPPNIQHAAHVVVNGQRLDRVSDSGNVLQYTGTLFGRESLTTLEVTSATWDPINQSYSKGEGSLGLDLAAIEISLCKRCGDSSVEPY